MTQRYDDILAFIEVVKAGSFTAAGARLAVAKSVVSDRVRNLENALGVELLRRTTRSVTPTERGQDFFDRMAPLVQAMADVVDAASDADGSLTGRLRMTAPISFGMEYLTPVITDFAKTHTELEIALDFDDRAVDIVGQGYDLALRIGRLADSALMARKLCDSDRVVCCSPGYARQHGRPKTVDDLVQHATIDYANTHASRLWSFAPATAGPGKHNAGPRTVETRSRIVVNNGEAMRDMAMAGLGIVVLPRFIVARALQSGALVELLPGSIPTPDAIYAVYPPVRHMPRKLRAMVDHLAASFAGTPPWLAAKPVKPAKAAKPAKSRRG